MLQYSSCSFALLFQAMKKYQYDDDPVLSTCGISIDEELTQVDGRVLETPKVNSQFCIWMSAGGIAECGVCPLQSINYQPSF